MTTVTPNWGQQGQRGIVVAVNGMFTSFAAGVTTISFGPGIAVTGPVQVTSPTTATVTVDVPASVPYGARAVTVTTGAEVVTLPAGFAVTPQSDGIPQTCTTAANETLSFAPGQSMMVTGTVEVPGNTEWMVLSLGPSASLTLTLQPMQPGAEFDMEVVAACGNPVIAASTPGNPSKQLSVPSNASSQSRVIVAIRATRWDPGSPWYRLTVVGH